MVFLWHQAEPVGYVMIFQWAKKVVGSQNYLTLLNLPIGSFMTNYHLPAFEEYGYCLPHIHIFGNKVCGKMHHVTRQNKKCALSSIFEGHNNWLSTDQNQQMQEN
jgi:hypothetical protein